MWKDMLLKFIFVDIILSSIDEYDLVLDKYLRSFDFFYYYSRYFITK